MRALDRKLLRDLVHLKSQLAAVALVLASGIAIFVTLRSAHAYLVATQEAYYRDYRFAQVFVHVKRAPRAVGATLRAIPGVAAAETRIVTDVILDVPGLDEPATGRLVSIPTGRRPLLNDLHLRRGRFPSRDRPSEVLVSEAFARANRLDPGSALGAVIEGRWQRLQVVGVALSPEYVYEIRGEGEVFPDNRGFGVLWMGEEALATAFGLSGAWNDASLTLTPGAVPGEVLDQLDRLLARYGGLGAYTREDQISNRFLTDEITETQATSVIVPTIFLAVSAFLLHIVMSRLVATQRDQLAVLKAFGYGNLAVGRHYLELALAPVLTGTVPGVLAGLWLASALARVYARFYQFPALAYRSHPGIVAAALAIAAGSALLGAVDAVRRAVALPPAEAMRPEAPARFRRGLAERLGLGRFLSPSARLVVRNVERRPVKSLLGVGGIALAVAVVVSGLFVFDAVDVLKEVQFGEVEREDLTVVFTAPRPVAARHALAHLPGVLRVEPFRAVPVRLRAGPRSHRTSLLGLSPGAELRRVVDVRGRARQPLPGGLLLTDTLAGMLGVAPGGTVTVEVLEGERPVREVPVGGVVSEMLGLGAYMDSASLHRLLREGETLSGAYLAVDRAQAPRLYTLLKRLPGISGVGLRQAVIEGFERTISESFSQSLWIVVGFACLIAFGVVYNAARISLSERGRELASLRVLGFSRGEVAVLLLGEQALLTLAALPVGALIGYGLAALITLRSDSELFRLPLIVRQATYVSAFLVVTGAALLSGFLVRRRLDRLDLVEVLKTRE